MLKRRLTHARDIVHGAMGEKLARLLGSSSGYDVLSLFVIGVRVRVRVGAYIFSIPLLVLYE